MYTYVTYIPCNVCILIQMLYVYHAMYVYLVFTLRRFLLDGHVHTPRNTWWYDKYVTCTYVTFISYYHTYIITTCIHHEMPSMSTWYVTYTYVSYILYYICHTYICYIYIILSYIYYNNVHTPRKAEYEHCAVAVFSVACIHSRMYSTRKYYILLLEMLLHI